MYLSHSTRARTVLFSAASLIVGCGSVVARPPSVSGKQHSVAVQASDESIMPCHARFGRTRPVIAIVGENSGTELTDYVIPYGILRQADVGEVLAVATKSGPMTMRPALRLQPQESIADFDARDVTPAFHPAAARDRPLLSRRSAGEATGRFKPARCLSSSAAKAADVA
jgi:hypothetical protein